MLLHINELKRQARYAIRIVEPSYGVRTSVPTWIRPPIGRYIAVGSVAKHIASVIQDDIENHIDLMPMGRFHHLHEVRTGAKMRVDIEEIVNPVAVVGVVEGNLLKDRTDPYRRHPQTLEIPDLAGQPFEGATHPVCPGLPPALGFLQYLNRVLSICGLEQGGRATPHTPPVIPPVSLLIAIGEAIQHQKIQHLVLPSSGRGKELPITESREIHF